MKTVLLLQCSHYQIFLCQELNYIISNRNTVRRVRRCESILLLEVKGQLHAPAALHQGKQASVPNEQRVTVHNDTVQENPVVYPLI